MGNAKARSTVTTAPDGVVTVRVTRDYKAGVPPTTAQRVWEIASDFGGVKKIFPTLIRNYITYPDNKDAVLHTVRDMTFGPEGFPPSSGIEELVEFDEQARRLVYISVFGLPVKGYRSVMEVTGDDACQLTWTSKFAPDPGHEDISKFLASLLAAGADQIATLLGLDDPASLP